MTTNAGEPKSNFADVWASDSPRARSEQKKWYLWLRGRFLASAGFGSITQPEKEALFQDAMVTVWDKVRAGLIVATAEGLMVKRGKTCSPLPDVAAYVAGVGRMLRLRQTADSRTLSLEEAPAEGIASASAIDFTAEPAMAGQSVADCADRVVRECIVSLPAHCRLLVEAYYLRGRKWAEILEEAPEGRSAAAFRVRKSKCLARLRRSVEAALRACGIRPNEL